MFRVQYSGSYLVASTAPEIAEFVSLDGSDVSVYAYSPGDVKLQLLDSTATEVIDQFPLRVDAVAQIIPAGRWNETLTILEGTSTWIHVDLFDAEGCMLSGTGAVEYTFEGDPALKITPVEGIARDIIEGEETRWGDSEYLLEKVKIEATSAGGGDIEVVSPSGASTIVPVKSVSLADVALIEAPELLEAKTSESVTVDVTVRASNGEPLYGAECIWSFGGLPAESEISERATEVEIESEQAADIEVRCGVGPRTSNTLVRFIDP